MTFGGSLLRRRLPHKYGEPAGFALSADSNYITGYEPEAGTAIDVSGDYVIGLDPAGEEPVISGGLWIGYV